GVVKMRRSRHSHQLHAYQVTSNGIEVGPTLESYRGILTGVPTRQERRETSRAAGLTEREAGILDRLVALREASVEELAKAADIAAADLSPVLARLMQLNYSIEIDRDGEKLYRAVTRPLTAS